MSNELTDAEYALVRRYRALKKILDEGRRPLTVRERSELRSLEKRLGVEPPAMSMPLLDVAARRKVA